MSMLLIGACAAKELVSQGDASIEFVTTKDRLAHKDRTAIVLRINGHKLDSFILRDTLQGFICNNDVIAHKVLSFIWNHHIGSEQLKITIGHNKIWAVNGFHHRLSSDDNNSWVRKLVKAKDVA